MLFRFLELSILPNNEYDYENAKYLGSIEHKDYVEYTKLLHLMKDMDCPMTGFGNLTLVKEVPMENDTKMEIDDEIYSIIDIQLRVPLDKFNLECVQVFVMPSC